MAKLVQEKKTVKKKKPFKKTAIKKEKIVPSNKGLTAKSFIERLNKYQSEKEREKIQRYFKSGEGDYGAGDEFIGVKMGQLFALAVEFRGMPINEIEKLLESKIHEVRAGGVSIMDKESRYLKTTPERRKEFYDLYMRRHDRINNWDLCDLGCLHMIGCHLFDKPRQVLYRMARSKNIWERRTAILGTCYFIRQGEVDDTFKIGELLLKDKEDLIHKATGWMLRFAGSKDQKRLLSLLDKHAGTMPRTLLRSCIEGLSQKQRGYYMGLRNEK
jgi:3-methyladenine DNA glycosylase AlkD